MIIPTVEVEGPFLKKKKCTQMTSYVTINEAPRRRGKKPTWKYFA
jgi:hypothetical protein